MHEHEREAGGLNGSARMPDGEDMTYMMRKGAVHSPSKEVK